MNSYRVLGGLFFLCLLLLPISAVAAPEGGQNSSKECSMCHLRWMDDFINEEKKDLLMEMPEARVAADEMMCYSCHDGSIADSRFRVWETSKHKSGIKPSENVTIPEEFPLDAEGKMTCATCHTSHGVDTRVDMASAIFLREANVGSSMCKRCHRDKDDGADEGMHPVDVEFDALPQEILDAGAKVGVKNTVICETCHTAHGSTGDNFLIIPNSEEGVPQSKLCETCHGLSPDMSSDGVLRRHSHPVDVDITDDAKLPARWDNGEEPYLGGGKKVNCRTCHSPHNGTKKNHLLVVNDGGDKLCMTCHSSKETILRTKHDIPRFNSKEPSADGEAAANGGVCKSCHFMHKGYGPRMWARQVEGESLDQLCISCHAKGEMAEEALTGEHSHPTGVGVDQAVSEKSGLPLFNVEGDVDVAGKVSCATCHDAHLWAVASDQRGGKDVDGDGNSSFLRKSETKQQALCRSCHQKQGAILGTEHDLSLEADRSKNSHGQGVERSGVCGACHLIHNADGDKLWGRNLGVGEDVIEQMCNACHSRGHLAEEKMTGDESHPMGGVPIFKVGKEHTLPLYEKNGRRSRQGGVSCATCHDLHSWSPGSERGPGEKKIEGDRFNSFLRQANDDDATLCATCHEVNAMILGSDHDLRVSAPREINMERLTADETGVCGACHMVHNAWGDGLWSRGVGSGKNRNEALCNGCHARRKSASKKRLHGPKHPMNKKVSEAKATLKLETARFYGKGKIDTELPLFTNEGERSPEGDITCSTCHNPHRWDPEKGAPRASKNLEGDGSNSFLRRSNLPTSGLCVTCHTQKANVVNTEHDMRITGQEEKNRLKQTVGESGVCSACHVPHDSMEGGYQLWARGLSDKSEMLPERLCLDCHDEGRVGHDKIVEEFSHPETVLVGEATRKKSKNYVPLYDPSGQKSNAGIITCPTCHNPHSWTPENDRQGPGRQLEGNNRSSFLRFKSARNVCSDCHGIESLRRYKYFHSERSDKKSRRRLRPWN
ncbi:MAG: cytochrome c3 family protein [Candidatus Polarisedimenticolaceae bacterium]|nr:cytochrome c3 family protein [Candidatus Polarisedimenticolaceae bacterium]